ncbi:hypothetical protein [Borrelia coriaceae]|nr:hypothetical protein [Borrelia coriaceae]
MKNDISKEEDGLGSEEDLIDKIYIDFVNLRGVIQLAWINFVF